MAATPDTQSLLYQLAHKNEDRGPLIEHVSIALIVISTVPVILRFIARWIRKLKWQIDDYFMIPALFFTLALCAENILSVKFGNGKHAVVVGLANSAKLIETIWFLSVTYALVHFFVKMSILFLFRRIFTTLDRTFRIALYVTMVYVICWSTATLFVSIFTCFPVSKYWHHEDPTYPGHCGSNILGSSLSLNALSTIADFALFGLPFIILTKLQLTLRRKIELAAIFSVGLFACAASVARIYTVYSEATTASLKVDPTFNSSDVLIWTAIEPAVGIVVACFPVVVPAFTRKALTARFPTRKLNSFHGEAAAGSGSGSGSGPVALMQKLVTKISGSGSGSGSGSKGSKNGTVGVSNGSRGARTWWRSQATTTAASRDSVLREEEDEEQQVGMEKNRNVFSREVLVPVEHGSGEFGEKSGGSEESLEEGRAVRPPYWRALGAQPESEGGIVVRTDLEWAGGDRAERPLGGVAK